MNQGQQEVLPMYGFDHDKGSIDQYFMGKGTYNFLKDNNSELMQHLVSRDTRPDARGNNARNFPDNLLQTRRDGYKPKIQNPYISDEEKYQAKEQRKWAANRNRMRQMGYDVENPDDAGDGFTKVNRHDEQIYDDMDMWLDKGNSESKQRYLKSNTREMSVNRVPQFPNSIISSDCSSVPLTRNQPNLNFTNHGRLPPHTFDKRVCEHVRLQDGSSRFVCKNMQQCKSQYQIGGMSIDKEMTQKMQTQVPTRRVERSKLGGPNQVRNSIGSMGGTFKDPDTASKVFFSRMSMCGNTKRKFDNNGKYVGGHPDVWDECQEVYPNASNLSSYDSKQLYNNIPFGIPGTSADLSFGLRTQYQRGGLSKESQLIQAAQAMNNTGSILHGDNVYLPQEGELKDTIIKI